jgi:hypothetical protein
MLILPFIHNITQHNNIEINCIKLLTIGGKHIWEENNSFQIDKDILNTNDIFRKGDIIKFNKELSICEVDTTKTPISDFYKCEEISIDDDETFCWRTYMYISGKDGVSWLDIPKNEKLGKYNIDEIIKKIIQKK